MSAVSRFTWRLAEKRRLAIARLRSKYTRAMGAQVGPKCLFGRGVRIDRPWTATFGQRCVLEPDVWLDVVADEARISIGDSAFLGRGTHLFVSQKVTIGNHVLIGDGAIISDHKHNTVGGIPIGQQGCNAAPIRVGDDVLICVRAIILQGVTIGDGAIIGPGAVVTQDVPPNAIVASPPGRTVGMRAPGPVDS